MKEKTWKLEVTEEQLNVISIATEVLSRVMIGQVSEALRYLPWADKENTYFGDHETIREVEAILAPKMVDHVDGFTSNLGITNEKVKDMARVSYDLHQSARMKLAWNRSFEKGEIEDPRLRGMVLDYDRDRDWSKMLGRVYDTPMKTSQEPLPKISGGSQNLPV